MNTCVSLATAVHVQLDHLAQQAMVDLNTILSSSTHLDNSNMANIREICAQLGFDSITQFGVHPKHAGDIKYDATPLLEESQEFVRGYVAQHGYPDLTEAAVQRNLYTDFVPIAHVFLNHNKFAQKHWPRGSTLNPWRGPKWPKDTDL